jgi:beta-fructofuranosidase
VLEVFVNCRTMISSRIYAAEETFGMRFFANDTATESEIDRCSGQTELLYARLWDGIGDTV